MESFLGMQVEQKDDTIKLHLDHYVQEMLTEYKDYIKRSLRIKRVPMNPGLVLHPKTVQLSPIRTDRSFSTVLPLFRGQASVCGYVDSL